MTRVRIARGSFVTALVLLAIALVVLAVTAVTAGYRALVRAHDPGLPTAPAILPPTPAALATAPQESYQGFLYGRISTVDGATYEGRPEYVRWEEVRRIEFDRPPGMVLEPS